MAEAATASTATEEEFVKSPEELLADYEIPAANAPKDLVAGRYRVLLNQPLPEFSKALATAYAVEDVEKQHTDAYALVCVNTMPYRMKGIEVLSGATPPALPRCYAAAPTPLSNPAETRMVLVMEKPVGKKLSELVAENGPFFDKIIIEKILKPLCDALIFLERYEINHGCINPDTLYFGTELKIGEPISEPSGYSQNMFFEPPERLMADRSGKGSGNTSTDAYAMAVLAIYLSQGKNPVASLNQVQLEERIAKMGAYHAFCHNIDTSAAMQDLLRGALNNNINERWGCEQVNAWLGGKRFNLILPSLPQDTSRTFSFNDEEFQNYRALAQAIYRNWEMAKTQLHSGKLVKWMELNASKEEAADMMARVVGEAHDEAESRRLSDEDIMKVISILDPFGPMRFKDISVNIDGLGKALAESFREKNTLKRQNLVNTMTLGLPAFLSGLIETDNAIVNNTLWRLQNLRYVLQLKGLGFGVERILYSLNPSLPCQSATTLLYHPVTIADTLNVLDRLAKQSMKKVSLIDTHLAAFLTSKLEISKELRVLELAGHPELFSDQRLVTLKLLALAQQKIGNTPLKGLAAWCAEMVLPIANKLHNRKAREAVIKEIKKAAASGIIERIAFILFKESLFSQDLWGYQRACNLHKYYKESIAGHEDRTKLKKLAMLNGRSISVVVGYFVLAAGIYFALDPYVRL